MLIEFLHFGGSSFWQEERKRYNLNCGVYATPDGLRGTPTFGLPTSGARRTEVRSHLYLRYWRRQFMKAGSSRLSDSPKGFHVLSRGFNPHGSGGIWAFRHREMSDSAF